MAQTWILFVIVGLCHIVSNAAQCTDRGRFPNNKVENCRGYTMCLSDANGAFLQYDLSCPADFIYSHIDSQCTNSTSYQCLLTYNCTGIGLIENNKSESCFSYIACVKGVTDEITARLVACPPDTVFSPIEGACVNQTLYMCDKGPAKPNILDAVNEIEIKDFRSYGCELYVNFVLSILSLSFVTLF